MHLDRQLSMIAERLTRSIVERRLFYKGVIGADTVERSMLGHKAVGMQNRQHNGPYSSANQSIKPLNFLPFEIQPSTKRNKPNAINVIAFSFTIANNKQRLKERFSRVLVCELI